MSLISLAYVSAASRDMDESDLKDILSTARDFNSTQDITGMLLYRNGYFIQALEGEEEAVTSLYDKIAKDDRHRNVLTVHKQKIDQRSFKDWSMGFHNLDDEDASDVEGYTDFLNQPFNEANIMKNKSRAVTLLELFKDGGSY